MKFRTEGLIIKEQNIGEQDKLIHALTKTNGVIKAFVRGAKNVKSGKSAATSLLSYSMLTVHPGRDSYSISDARTLRVFSRLRQDVKKMCLAQYFCELALTICPREKSAEKYLSLMLNSLYLLNEDKRPAELIKPCLEMRLAAMSGYLPDLIMCRSCGVYTAPSMWFFPRTGAIECSRCRAVPLGQDAEKDRLSLGFCESMGHSAHPNPVSVPRSAFRLVNRPPVCHQTCRYGLRCRFPDSRDG